MPGGRGESPFGKSKEDTLKESPVLAIYELEGDTLRVCRAALEKTEGPAELAAKPGSGLRLVVLKRQKPWPDRAVEPNAAGRTAVRNGYTPRDKGAPPWETRHAERPWGSSGGAKG